MKGIILSGGTGSRLYPLTTTVNKQLLAVYDKPMIYYPLTTLMRNGIKEICIISSPQHIKLYMDLFRGGDQWGMKFDYIVQPNPEGLPQAFLLAEQFIADQPSCLILGDNIFHGDIKIEPIAVGCAIYAYQVNNPSAYGVVEINEEGKIVSLEEKPKEPKSKLAVTGLYSVDGIAPNLSKMLAPSARGELEIVDLINLYCHMDKIDVEVLPRGTAWLDAGTPSSLFQAAAYVQSVQERTGVMIGCPEEVAYQQGFIDKQQFQKLVENTPKSEYRNYLERQL